MFKRIVFALLLVIPLASWSQGDTALVSFRKLFRWKPLPYDVSFNNKEFEMDSIWNSVEDNGYIKYRAEVLQKSPSMRIPGHLSKRFIKLDTIAYSENHDTLHAEFYAIGYIGGIRNVFCYIIERQLAGRAYRSSEKYLFTLDKKCRPIDRLLLTHEIPGAPNMDNFDIFSDNFNQLTWFEETKGIVYEDMTLELEDELGKVRKFKVKDNGRIQENHWLK
jgi:hypothetical protein